MSFIIREGQKEDMQNVMHLIKELALFEKLPNEVEVTEVDLIKDGFSEHPKFKTFVAEENNKIVGTALFYERYSTWKGRVVHLEDLIVTKHKRGFGIGIALYKSVLKYAYDLGAKRVVWDVLSWNKNAIDFYKSTGATVLEDWQVVHMKEHDLKNFIES
ncbi:MAG: GNAT family N-acetyltransferase [Polaribacter sp.]|nr:GNAT family N-acetyltransferase [Polaribacter sp.]MDG1810882.1 GNAT family N-acetyltransferase [Polaribacter sp.]MDG1993129.1 GNAT family N-acetyltransferase [Polaribacter sp.]